MKKTKLRLDNITINSFVTGKQSADIIGGSCDCSLTTFPQVICDKACSAYDCSMNYANCTDLC